ncbi:MAG: hypothetical protein GXP31_02055 [Kiritimatiellaeota bacterium]|nr:hypothetical protein [Kiritimatiellota bacterium]
MTPVTLPDLKVFDLMGCPLRTPHPTPISDMPVYVTTSASGARLLEALRKAFQVE